MKKEKLCAASQIRGHPNTRSSLHSTTQWPHSGLVLLHPCLATTKVVGPGVKEKVRFDHPTYLQMLLSEHPKTLPEREKKKKILRSDNGV